MMHHCSDETLLSHLDAELDAESDKAVVEHLGACWGCRHRLALLERNIHKLVELSERGVFPGPAWRSRTEAKLQTRMAEYRASTSLSQPHKLPWVKFTIPSYGRATWLTSLTVAILVVAGALFLMPSKIEAKAVLLRSIQAERRALSQLRAQHKTWNVEQYAAGKMVARRRVEQWQGENARPAALRVYDEHKTLVAGEWVSKTGLRTRYRKGQPAAVQAAAATSALPHDMDEAGLFKLSAQEFIDLVGNNPQAEIRKDKGSLIVEFAANTMPADSGAPKLLKATLVLAEDGLRPTGGVLVVDSQRNWLEYRLQETGLEQYTSEPPAHVFDQEEIDDERSRMAAITPVSRPVLPHEEKPIPEMPASANPALELKLIQRLALENITLGEQVRLERKNDGTVHLHIRVASEEKRSQVDASLADLIAEGGLTVDFEIGLEKQPAASAGPIPSIFSQWAAEKLGQEGTPASKPEVERVAQEEMLRMASDAQRMYNHAIAVREIGGRFRQADLDRLNEEQRGDWKTAVFQHIQALETEAILLQRKLAGILHDPPREEIAPPSKGTVTVHSVAQEVERIRAGMEGLLNSSQNRGASGPDRVRELLRQIQSCRTRLATLRPAFEDQ